MQVDVESAIDRLGSAQRIFETNLLQSRKKNRSNDFSVQDCVSLDSNANNLRTVLSLISESSPIIGQQVQTSEVPLNQSVARMIRRLNDIFFLVSADTLPPNCVCNQIIHELDQFMMCMALKMKA